MHDISIRELTKSYMAAGKRHTVLQQLDLTLYAETFHVLIGKSGCGKTTLLRLLAGLDTPDSGRIDFGNKPPKIGIVFQEPRLYPWLTVMENICLWQYGKRGGSRKKAEYYLHRLGLASYKDAYPHQLSGGMAQRAAIGRALSYEPELLLLDEPFGALDYFTRQQLQEELMQLYTDEKKTILFITHDITEAARLGERLLVINNGRIAAEILQNEPYPRPALADRVSLQQRMLFALQS